MKDKAKDQTMCDLEMVKKKVQDANASSKDLFPFIYDAKSPFILHKFYCKDIKLNITVSVYT